MLLMPFLNQLWSFCKKYVVDMRKKKVDLNAARVCVEDKKKQNSERCLEVPAEVSPWLEEVRQITDKLEAFPSDAVLGCLELKSRRKLGREAFEISKTIQDVLQRRPQFPEIERKIPLGRIDSTTATASSSDHHNNEIQSRVQTYNKALELLSRPDHEHHLVALWGMGGVGKTTMMEKLRQTVVEKRMFSYIARLVIGQNLDVKAIQDSIALYLGIELNDKEPKEVRVDQLLQGYKARLGEDKKTFLVILDDVWRAVDLEDIGLNRLQNQGVDFKVLITSRDQAVCTEMGVKADSILKVSLLDEAEAQSLFRQFLEPYSTGDVELEEKLVRKCCGLPIAIKTMACTLRGKSNDTWKNALSSLQPDDINTVFTTSYHNLQNEATKSIFLLCGLFPEDFDIRTEDLLRYGWGLNLFKGKDAIIEARYMLNTCIERLIHTNLLINSDEVGCVKMHDLVRDFVLVMFSKVEHASIVNHDSKPDWPETENDIRASCKRISLTCEAMSEFSHDLKFPNLMILKLMDGDESLMFPRNFYEEMRKLQVISYDYMRNTWLPSSLDECSTKLRVLRLHRCSLTFDLSSIGNLANLEVLSFAKSNIKSLPSTIGQLKKLRLLDVTGCGGLRIDNGVFKNLVKLEELYAKIANGGEPSITFTGDNCNEVAERWNNFCALEFEFIENNAQWKNLSVEKLKLFTISVGCSFDIDWVRSMHSFRNTLKLVTKKGELLQYKINELFKKTEVLCLSMNDTKDLKDIGVNPSSFRNIRVLVFSNCKELGYLFTLDVAKVLSYLEQLRVDNCCVMKELIHVEIGGEETITFPKLKILSLFELPKLLGFCQNVNISIALPQLVKLHMKDILNITSIICSKNKSATSCLLRGEEVLIPKLEILYVEQMDNLEEIWPCDFVMREEGRLKKIKVSDCDKLVNLFPCNPMPLLHNLEELEVIYCGSIKALFNIDLDCVGETGEGGSNSLRSIEVYELEKLEEVWRIKGANHSRIPIRGFRKIDVGRCDNLVNLFPCNPMPLLHNLEVLKVGECGSIEALFNIDLDCVGETGESGSSSSLRSIVVEKLEKLEEVWRIKGANHSRIPIRGFQAVERIRIRECKRFRNVFSPTTTNFDMGALTYMDIDLGEIGREYGLMESSQGQENTLFPAYLIHSFHNLRKLELKKYDGVEVIFEIKSSMPTSQDDQLQRILPYLEKLEIESMQRMSHVWKCNWNEYFLIPQKQLPSESPFHNLTTIYLSSCKSIKYLFSPLMAKLLSNLKKVEIIACDGMEEVVSNRDDIEDEEKIASTSTSTHTISTTLFPLLDYLRLYNLPILKCVGGDNGAQGGNNEISFNGSNTSFIDQYKFSGVDGVSWTLCQYPREINIQNCEALSSAIPWYAAGQMHKLQVLYIIDCKVMKEVFETQGISNSSVIITMKLGNLKNLHIHSCDLLEHIFTFSTFETLVQLEELYIGSCKGIKVIVVKEEDDGEQATRASSSYKIVSRLKFIILADLPELVGFFLGTDIEFQWPSLDNVSIYRCPRMKVFTAGGSTAPQLKYVKSRLGKHSPAHAGFNSHSTTTTTGQHPESTNSWYPAATSEGTNVLSFHNLVELCIRYETDEKAVVPSNELLHLKKLEKIDLRNHGIVEKVFEEPEAGTNSTTAFDESPTVVNLPNLRQVDLAYLDELRYLWKSNRWTIFEFPNLTTVCIEECDKLEHVFTSSMLGSLNQLQDLSITRCKQMEEVIVEDENNIFLEKEESDDGKTKEIVLPRLKSLKLIRLPGLKGFCLSKVDFSFPLLETLTIRYCPSITTFTKGNLSTPKLIKENEDQDY